jgi:hypothetical protein
MADKPVAKVGLAFEVPLTTMGASSVRAACDELRNRLLAYAEVLEKDRNVICTDIYVSQPGSALFDLKSKAADTTEARLKAVEDKGNGAVAQPPKFDAGEPAKPKPAKAAKVKNVEPEAPPVDDPEDPPRVVAVPIVKKASIGDVQLDTAQWIAKAIPHTGKRTPKTLALLTALIEANGEASPDELSVATKGEYSNLDVSSWLGQCLKKKNPYVVRGERGKYRFVKEDKG